VPALGAFEGEQPMPGRVGLNTRNQHVRIALGTGPQIDRLSGPVSQLQRGAWDLPSSLIPPSHINIASHPGKYLSKIAHPQKQKAPVAS